MGAAFPNLKQASQFGQVIAHWLFLAISIYIPRNRNFDLGSIVSF